MAEGLICNECMTVSPEEAAIGWWHLSSVTGHIVLGETRDYHFCSWAHLAAYAAKATGRKASS